MCVGGVWQTVSIEANERRGVDPSLSPTGSGRNGTRDHGVDQVETDEPLLSCWKGTKFICGTI